MLLLRETYLRYAYFVKKKEKTNGILVSLLLLRKNRAFSDCFWCCGRFNGNEFWRPFKFLYQCYRFSGEKDGFLMTKIIFWRRKSLSAVWRSRRREFRPRPLDCGLIG